jgi:general secretion pathway protein K
MKHTHNNRGFVLVATIWLLAILALSAAFFAKWVDSALDAAQAQHLETQGQIDIESTKATLFYLFATQGVTAKGLELPLLDTNQINQPTSMTLEDFLAGSPPTDMGEIVKQVTGNELLFDGSAYQGAGSALFSIQDEAGLLSLNTPNRSNLGKRLEMLSIQPTVTQELINKLIDFTDADDYHLPNGAESYHYKQQRLPPPTNTPLISRFQLSSILGWMDAPQLWRDPTTLDSFTIERTSAININSAPKAVLLAVFNLSEEQADLVLSERNKHPFESLSDINQRTSLQLTNYYESLRFISSSYFRVHFWHKDSRLEREVSIRLSNSASRGAPWLIVSDLTLKLPKRYVETEPLQPQTILFSQ